MTDTAVTTQRGKPQGHALEEPDIVFVLLSSSLVRHPFALATPQHLLDFEVSPETTLLEHWAHHIPVSHNSRNIAIRVMLAPDAPAPTSVRQNDRLRVLRDRDDYRGPAGAMIDSCEDLPPNTVVIALESTRLLFAPFAPMIDTHTQQHHDITIVTDAIGHPLGITITTREMLDTIPRRGYIDFKEQWLTKQISQSAKVFSHRVPLGSSLQIYNRKTLLAAMSHFRRLSQPPSTHESVALPRSTHDYILRSLDGQGHVHTDGCAISGHPSAPGSYIMKSAHVPPTAVVARCVVFPGARIEENETVTDMLIGPIGRMDDEQFLRARRSGGRA